MAAKIVFNYDQMDSAVNTLNKCATDYEQAATTLKASIDPLLSIWTGASRDKFATLWEGSVYPHIHESIPASVRGLADVLKSNATTMQEADSEIAGNIPNSITG